MSLWKRDLPSEPGRQHGAIGGADALLPNDLDAALRSYGTRRSRSSRRGSGRHPCLLVADDGRRFLTLARQRLLTSPVDVEAVTDPDLVLSEVERLKPQVVILSEAFEAGRGRDGREPERAGSLMPALRRRFPDTHVIVVADEDGVDEAREWELRTWGALGVVPRVRLLQGRTLPRLVLSLIRRSGGEGSSTAT